MSLSRHWKPEEVEHPTRKNRIFKFPLLTLWTFFGLATACVGVLTSERTVL
ncbi:hypothetical protein SynMITS9220_02177 [Synechococcus sp. MIT S9220]|nr:hypothetical protein SynMITS9220_02177 [Synechococcus sp. MIT S9220]